ncbi:MAG: SIMPL domain-containing protein [Alphaproteobacteria bacterium]|nr:SIMPL domain-containing protein [Alphaproteobacteria bacterium]MDD9919921.1 SIMPL domain-containing protein [Alphaproteobacteria bacterium]
MRYLLTAIALFVAPFSWAEVPQDATVLNLSATARQAITPDTLNANLRIEHKAATPEAVQQFINARMQRAVAAVERMKSVKISTGSYYVNERWIRPHEKSKERKKVWQGSQSLALEGKDQTQILKAVGALQKDGFLMQGLNYSLSKEVSESFQESLMAEALSTIQQRAERFGKQLNKNKVHIARVNFNGNVPHRPMMQHRMLKAEMTMAADAMAEPVARPDEMDITATVNAEVWLQ